MAKGDKDYDILEDFDDEEFVEVFGRPNPIPQTVQRPKTFPLFTVEEKTNMKALKAFCNTTRPLDNERYAVVTIPMTLFEKLLTYWENHEREIL